MASLDEGQMPKVLAIYLRLTAYPLLAPKIREMMRHELFSRGIVTPEEFEHEVGSRAVLSQEEEGLSKPWIQESAEEWIHRLEIVRDHMTDFYFAVNLPQSLFEEILRSAIAARKPGEKVILTFNPELAPWAILFAQAEEYEQLPPEDRARVQHHLQQILVVLIRGMISDQLDFIAVAKDHFSIYDLKEIYRNRLARGKIGGKAAGLMLAYKILQEPDPTDPVPISPNVVIPRSFFIGADLFYDFLAHNNLFGFFDEKYKSRDEIEADYPEIVRRFRAAEFPEPVVQNLARLAEQMEGRPLIVRSSSLLEDNFGKAFAGKYESIFCPNQGTREENLAALLDAIRVVYASTLNPDALFYRQRMGLVDYDERMALLVQQVEGSPYGRYFFPAVAGVAFGRNPFRWSPRIRLEDGFMRIVWGLGTRAVERVANDYPRMVALSHPQLRPEFTAEDISKYSQHFADVIDLQDDQLKTLPVHEVLGNDYPWIELLASVEEEDYITPLRGSALGVSPDKMILTFDRLLQDKSFVTLMKAILKKLQRAYGRPVDIEFTVEIVPGAPQPRCIIHLLQCRPLSSRQDGQSRKIPESILPADIVFTAGRMVPEGVVSRIEYIIYVDPRQYARIPDMAVKHEIARVIGRLNKALERHRFILVGPGRWGSSNIDLGVRVTYADLYNTSMLVEVAFASAGGTPEVSYGTHFFQDLVETNIYPLPLYPGESGSSLNEAFFRDSPNVLGRFSPPDARYSAYVKLIDVREVSGGRLLEVIMNADEDRAVAYLRYY